MNKTILVIDDEANIGNSLKRSLSLAGYTVFTATSAKDGLAILEHHPIPVIICDQLMPQMTGAECLAKVKELYPNTIRIIFTAYAEFNMLSDALKKGDVHKILSKPWEEEYLVKHINSAFEQYQDTIENKSNSKSTIDSNMTAILTNSELQITNLQHNPLISSRHTIPDTTNLMPTPSTHTAIMITDSELNIQSINSIFCLNTGYDSASIIGTKIHLIDTQQDPLIMSEIEISLKQKGSWQGFIQLCKKSGEPFSTLLSISSVMDTHKTIKQYTYTFTVPNPHEPIMQQGDQPNSPLL